MVAGYQPLPDSEWQIMSTHLNLRRKRRYAVRQVPDAIRYVCRTGCQWRTLPNSFPPWELVYCYFARWQVDNHELVAAK
jgi:transposase